jgi:hypothetical protein
MLKPNTIALHGLTGSTAASFRVIAGPNLVHENDIPTEIPLSLSTAPGGKYMGEEALIQNDYNTCRGSL